MSYAQRNYPQLLGNSKDETIANAGCFLASFCNLSEDFGANVDPLSLNSYFKGHGVYIGLDDLYWDSITKYDSSIVAGHTSDHGTDRSAGWPSTNQSIVRFYYRSVSHPTLANGQPNMIYHFCKVADANAHLIIDSWDGALKKTPYGEPTGWAEYTRQVAAPAPAAVVHPYTVELIDPKQVMLNKDAHLLGMNYDNYTAMFAHPIETTARGSIRTVIAICHHQLGSNYYMTDPNSGAGYELGDCDNYTPPAPVYVPPAGAVNAGSPAYAPIVKDIPGYMTATNAANHTNPVSTLRAGSDYFLFTSKYGMDNVTLISGQPGAWINPADNVIEPYIPLTPVVVTPSPISELPTPPIPPKVSPRIEVDPNAWKTTNAPLILGWKPVPYRATNPRAITIRDLDGRQGDRTLEPYCDNEIIHLVSTFEKDGIRYGRTDKVATQGWWYGIPMEILQPDHIYAASETLKQGIARNTAADKKLIPKIIKKLRPLTKYIDSIMR